MFDLKFSKNRYSGAMLGLASTATFFRNKKKFDMNDIQNS